MAAANRCFHNGRIGNAAQLAWLLVSTALCGCRATTPPFLADQHGQIVHVVVTGLFGDDKNCRGELSKSEIQALTLLLDASRGRWEAIGRRQSLLLVRDYQLDIEWGDGYRESLLIGRTAIFRMGTGGYVRIAESQIEPIYVHLKVSIQRGKLATNELQDASRALQNR